MQTLSRRSLLGLGGMTAMSGVGARTDAAPLTSSEQANAKLVTDFCTVWAKKDIEALMPFVADTVSYRITETTPAIVGREAFHDRIKGILERLTSIEYRVVETLAKGPVVLNERRDTLVSAQGTRLYHAVGMFFLIDSKIVEWTDYIIREG